MTVDLPPGSRERAGVVNLVDAEAAAELEAFFLGKSGSLMKPTNLFLKYYAERYDFIYLFPDHEVEATVSGRFQSVTSFAMPGTGIDYDSEEPGYTSNGRTRGAMAVRYSPGGYGPIVHEMLHYWGVFLSSEFGFGAGRDGGYAGHWGYAGFRGILGGFDANTLTCTSPAGAVPPSCAPEADGRYRYRVGSFSGGGNDVDELAPLELYLMGLLPASELPATIPVLANGERLGDTYDAATNTVEVEADGIDTVETAAILAKHGEVRLLPASERAFTSAFVVISAAPAQDAVLDELGERAKNHAGKPANLAYPQPSFHQVTRGLATMDTTLGPRRRRNDAAPEPRAGRACDLFEQDCGNGKACHYRGFRTLCSLTRGAREGEACSEPADCAAGLGCSQNQAGQAVCAPYCDLDSNEANACDCTPFLLTDEAQNLLGALCLPP